MGILNSYEDAKRAETYARLKFPGTYYLAYRDIPAIISENIKGNKAIDFGCGAGRSTRFLTNLGFNSTGIDISADMIKKAKEIDPEGDYRLIEMCDLTPFSSSTYDLVLSVFTFDNIPTWEEKVKNFQELGRVLNHGGRVVSLVSSPEMYTHEWASFSTKDFPENKYAKSGDKVKIIITDTEDERPVEDVIWSEEDYFKVYEKAGLELVKAYRPLAKESEPYPWVNETKIAPWVIYVLEKTNKGQL